MKFKKKKQVDTQQVSQDETVVLPNQVMEKLLAKDEEKAMLRVEGSRVVIEFLNKNIKVQNILFRWFFIPAIISSIIFIVFFMQEKQIYLVGDSSISSMTMIFGLVTGLGAFSYFFIQGKRGNINTASKDIYWRNFPTVLLSFAVILWFVLLVSFKGVDLLFKGASFDLYTATLIFFVFLCVINYFMIKMSLTLTPPMLTNLLIIVIIGGVASAMITNNEEQWWQYNFSFLGTPDASNSWRFNITLIFSALLMVALIDYLFVIIQKAIPASKNLMTLRVLLILTALCLGGVGLFPYNELVYFQKIHDFVARALVILIIFIIVGLKWLLPKPSKDFLKLSYVIGLALLISTVLFLVVGYFSLMAFELIAFFLAFSWILLLLQELQRLAIDVDSSFAVTVKAVPVISTIADKAE